MARTKARRRRRRKRLLKLAVLCLLTLAGIVFCRQLIAQKAVETFFTEVTGFPMRVDSVQITPWRSRFAADRIQLFNPPEFCDRFFADIPRFDVDYEAGSFLRDRPHFTRADLHIREIVIVKNTNGHSNVEQLRGLGAVGRGTNVTGVRFHIDTLNLRLGRVIFKDYSDGTPEEHTRDLNMAVTFRNVSETTDLNRKVFYAVLKRMWLGPFASAVTIPERER
jgi:hypothetical protein